MSTPTTETTKPADMTIIEHPENTSDVAVMSPRETVLGDGNTGLAASDTATLDAEMVAALTAMDAAHKIRENGLAGHYSAAVRHLGLAIRAAMGNVRSDPKAGDGNVISKAVKIVRDKLMAAAKARTETQRLTILRDGKHPVPADKQPKRKPGAYIQAYSRVLDLARWTPGVDAYRLDNGKGKRPENPVSMVEPFNGIPVQDGVFTSPVDALASGYSLESVHQAWVNYVRPAVIDLADYEERKVPAVKAAFGRFFVTVRTKADGDQFARPRRFKLADDAGLLAAACLAALEASSKLDGGRARVLEAIDKYRSRTERNETETV